MAQFLGEEGRELGIPLAQRLTTDLNPTLLESFLNITLAKGEAVVEPESVLDDAQRKAVALGLAVSHGDQPLALNLPEPPGVIWILRSQQSLKAPLASRQVVPHRRGP